MAGRFNRHSNNIDLIVANNGNQGNDCSLSYLKGNGDSTFQVQYTTPLPDNSSPLGLVAGDFNNDNKLDIAFANYWKNSISVLLGNGDGTFQPQPTTCQVGQQPRDIAVGKFTGHDWLDLAVSNEGSGQLNSGSISVLLNNGNGTFQPQQTYQEVGTFTRDAAVGNFTNHGGVDDIAVTSWQEGTVSVLLNKRDGTGTFNPQTTYQVGKNPVGIAVGHFTNHDWLDIAVTNSGDPTISILPNKEDGTGTFQPQQPYQVGLNPEGIAASNLRGDGDLDDIAVANEASNNVMVLLQDQ
ncbi:hypothetical protein KSC_000040 [Ktedonobacter sp. SOSP1-52]|uniref:FG-GAP repeat domain-containing protein n=1 Tax=Ktedonobacter sp. SOSP1-52 TaxID=2778366 RepID=UPI0019150342|nr:VCBS repeat-containing protein [Ktedonobacter sp. SOSP1-52]GHO61112.1 hypothetical protein KSC_000040 [Ktedonobacter sp. SOSP1-52]